MPGALVWAHWRLQYYTPAIVDRKKSRSREVWQVRPLHRTASTLDLSAEHLLPLLFVQDGDQVLHMTDRRNYSFTTEVLLGVVEGDEPLARLGSGLEVPLSEVVIHLKLFQERHRAWKSNPASSLAASEIDMDAVEAPEMQEVLGEGENRHPLLGAGIADLEAGKENVPSGRLFSGLSFLVTGSAGKAKLTDLILGNGGSVVASVGPSADTERLVLIGDEAAPCRTAKYFCAVLLGVDCLKPSWVHASVSRARLAPRCDHLLDPAIRTKARPSLFSDTRLAFVGSRAFRDSCEQVASFASATIVDPRQLGSQPASTVVVLESRDALKPRLLATCSSHGHVLVEKDWFTDSILAGQLLEFSM